MTSLFRLTTSAVLLAGLALPAAAQSPTGNPPAPAGMPNSPGSAAVPSTGATAPASKTTSKHTTRTHKATTHKPVVKKTKNNTSGVSTGSSASGNK